MAFTEKLTPANLVSSVRLVCAPLLFVFPPFSRGFYAVYSLGILSDMLDGVVARKFRCESGFGEKLDTVCDAVFLLFCAVRVGFAISLPLFVWICAGILACGKVVHLLFGLFGRGRVLPHSFFNRASGVMLALAVYLLPLVPDRLAVLPALLAIACAEITEGRKLWNKSGKPSGKKR